MRPTSKLWGKAGPATRGIVFMVLSTVGFSAMHALVRYVSADLHPIQIAFFRNFFGLVVIVPWLLREGLGVLRTERLSMHGLRAVLNVTAMFAFFTALSLTPIAEVTALSFTAPIFTALLSLLVLGERFRLRRWSAIVCGFAGTLVILRPGFQAIDLGAALVLGSAVLWGATMIVIKLLGRSESSITITAYMNILLALLSFVPALFVWRGDVPLATWGWLVVIGILGTLAQIALAQSLKETEAGLVMPFDFLKLIWAAAFGYLLFTEVPDHYVWIGGAIIFASSSYIAYRESRLRKEEVSLPPPGQ